MGALLSPDPPDSSPDEWPHTAQPRSPEGATKRRLEGARRVRTFSVTQFAFLPHSAACECVRVQDRGITMLLVPPLWSSRRG